MIEIEVNQDIREYKTKLIGPFTTRQVICLILGGTTVIGAYNLLQPYLTSDTGLVFFWLGLLVLLVLSFLISFNFHCYFL